MSVRAALALAVFAFLELRSPDAGAEARARFVYLRGAGTETCPNEVDVRQAVQVRLGYDPFSSYAASTMFTEVTRLPSGFAASLKFVDGDNAVRGDRKLEVRGACTELMEAMALSISIAIDPMSVTRDGPPPDAPPTERPVDLGLPSIRQDAPSSPAEPDAVTPEAPPPASPPIAIALTLGPVVSVGSAPSTAIGGLVGGEAWWKWMFGGVELRADAPASAETRLGEVESSLVTGAVIAGIRESIFFAGLVGSLGQLSATSTGVAAPHDRSSLVVSGGGRVGIAVPVAGLVELRARVEALATPTRHTLTINNTEVFEYPVASGSAAAGVAVRFR